MNIYLQYLMLIGFQKLQCNNWIRNSDFNCICASVRVICFPMIGCLYVSLIDESLKTGINSGVECTPIFFIYWVHYEYSWRLKTFSKASKSIWIGRHEKRSYYLCRSVTERSCFSIHMFLNCTCIAIVIPLGINLVPSFYVLKI